jgi:hypothetical protein
MPMGLRYRRSLLGPMIAAMALVIAASASARTPKAKAPQQWQSLFTQAMEANATSAYRRGIVPAQQALRLARQIFGNRDLRTVLSLDILALLYLRDNNYGEAERAMAESW